MAAHHPDDMTEDEVRDLLCEQIQEAGGVTALAVKWVCSPAYISDVMNGRRSPGPRILGPLGLQRVVTVAYRPAPTHADPAVVS